MSTFGFKYTEELAKASELELSGLSPLERHSEIRGQVRSTLGLPARHGLPVITIHPFGIEIELTEDLPEESCRLMWEMHKYREAPGVSIELKTVQGKVYSGFSDFEGYCDDEELEEGLEEEEASSLYYYVEKMDYNSYGVKFISSNLNKAIKVAISMAMIEEHDTYTYEVKLLRNREETTVLEVDKVRASKLLETIV